MPESDVKTAQGHGVSKVACHSLALVSGWQGGTSPHLTPREGRNMYADREEVEAARDEFYSGDIDAWEFYAIAELWDGDLAELL